MSPEILLGLVYGILVAGHAQIVDFEGEGYVALGCALGAREQLEARKKLEINGWK